MSAFSIRSLPKGLERALIREAKRRGTTKTEVVIRILKAAFGIPSVSENKNKKITDFFGKMTPQEFQSFRKATEGFSEIDEELWK